MVGEKIEKLKKKIKKAEVTGLEKRISRLASKKSELELEYAKVTGKTIGLRRRTCDICGYFRSGWWNYKVTKDGKLDCGSHMKKSKSPRKSD